MMVKAEPIFNNLPAAYDYAIKISKKFKRRMKIDIIRGAPGKPQYGVLYRDK